MKAKGIQITNVYPGSPAYVAGIRPGCKLIELNSHVINDAIDLAFYSHEPDIVMTLKNKKGSLVEKVIKKNTYESIGIELAPLKVKRCNNRCIFCFVSQLPKGMRKPLYVKDEDYRLSFLYGNYLTLSNLSNNDKKRIVEQRLSPLYISVHSTSNEIRHKMIGNTKAPDIINEIKYFTKHKIRLHIQIVLCPGYNDNNELEKTIKDLIKFYPYISSIAVVPIGLTQFSNGKVKPVTEEDAKNTIAIIDRFRKKFMKKYGEAIVYAGDEFYIKAGMDFPLVEDYGEFPQIENGVGMVPEFLHQSKKVTSTKISIKKPIITFTGTSFYSFLNNVVSVLNKKYETDITVIPVENHFFGTTVTVAGLLTGRDIIKALLGRIKGDELLFIPDVVLKEEEKTLLDDLTVNFIKETLNVETVVVKSNFKGLINALKSCSKKAPGGRVI